ncbi:MAG: hypothetical protein PHX18_07130 [Candidatus Gastranaerophilales bacterium]|nr:hypothetical protein [Candidatus Gastranaerophilales bacterium]
MQVQFNTTIKKGYPKNNDNRSQTITGASFKGSSLLSKAGTVNQVLMNKFENGGFFLEFFCLDFIGLVFPRVWQAFNRNKAELGHWNVMAGIEELLRESITGPSMFLIPMVALAFAGRFLGKGAKINTNVINKFTKIFRESASNLANSDMAKLSKEFTGNLFDDLFAKHIKNAGKIAGEAADGISIGKYREKFCNMITEAQGTITKQRRKELTGEFSNLISDINSRYTNSLNTRAIPFVNGKGKDCAMLAGDLFEDIQKYAQDIIPTAKLTASELTEKSPDAIKASIDQISKMRENGRRFLTTLNILSLAGVLSLLPKIYQRAKSNPALEGLKHEKGGNA